MRNRSCDIGSPSSGKVAPLCQHETHEYQFSVDPKRSSSSTTVVAREPQGRRDGRIYLMVVGFTKVISHNFMTTGNQARRGGTISMVLVRATSHTLMENRKCGPRQVDNIFLDIIGGISKFPQLDEIWNLPKQGNKYIAIFGFRQRYLLQCHEFRN